MKKLIALLTLFVGLQAHAGLINIELNNNEVSIGETIELSITGSEFSSFDALNVDVEFDTALFTFDEGSVSGDLFDTSPFSFTVSSQVFGIAVSYLDFTPFMGGDFVIASFTLSATAVGKSSFALTNMVAGEFFSGPLEVTSNSGPISANISATEVSTPNTVGIIFTLGFILIGMRRLNLR